MAQNSAHLTQTLQAKPSIFELVAADSLQATFHPALKRIAYYFTNLNPAKYGWLLKYYDEVYLGLTAIIQQHYIRAYGGSLSEVFYGLSRIRTKSSEFSRSDKILSFLLVCIWPYIQTKFEAQLNKWENDCDNQNVDGKTAQRRRNIQKSYKMLKGIHDLFQVIQYIGYLSDRFDAHSIVNRIIGQHMIYLPFEANFQWNWIDLFSANFKKSTILSGMIFRGLELSAFFLQFIQWWQNETSNGSLTKLPTPEPPAKHPDAADRYANICPICLQQWAIPTVNRISGCVFCYKCIVKHLDSNGRCPVTKHSTTIDDLVRIYDL